MGVHGSTRAGQDRISISSCSLQSFWEVETHLVVLGYTGITVYRSSENVLSSRDTAHAMRAILLAKATAAMLFPRRSATAQAHA
jgi:hypothetical protein